MLAWILALTLLAGCGIDRLGVLDVDAGPARDASARDARGEMDAEVERDAAPAPMDAAPMDVGTTGEDVVVPILVPDTGPPPTPDAGGYDTIDLECESGVITGLDVVVEATASGTRAVLGRAGPADWYPDGVSLQPRRIDFAMMLRGGDYDVWVRFYTTDGAHDAYYAGFGPADLRRFYHRSYGTYQWRRGSDDDLRALAFPGLPAGPYVLSLGPGESDVFCDRAIVTNDPAFIPPG